jgi:hypothetical protein
LRPRIAATLGVLGDRAALPALLRAFAEERYPESRAAEARALLSLGARRKALEGIERYLGMASSLPAGVALLLEAGALKRGARAGAELSVDERSRAGPWRCDELGCAPGHGSEITLPRASARGAALRRLTVRVHAEAHDLSLDLAGTRLELPRGDSEPAVVLTDARARSVSVSADPGVRVRAFVVVPALPELPPPPKEPWKEEAATP